MLSLGLNRACSILKFHFSSQKQWKCIGCRVKLLAFVWFRDLFVYWALSLITTCSLNWIIKNNKRSFNYPSISQVISWKFGYNTSKITWSCFSYHSAFTRENCSNEKRSHIRVYFRQAANYERHFKSENENRFDSYDSSVVHNNKINQKSFNWSVSTKSVSNEFPLCLCWWPLFWCRENLSTNL